MLITNANIIEVDNPETTVLRLPDEPRSVSRPETIDSPDPETARKEREANDFAAELLMPERTVRRMFNNIFGSDRLWIGSTEVQQILSRSGVKVIDAARELATLRYRNSTSLVEFFNVSKEAMAFRLLELRLVY